MAEPINPWSAEDITTVAQLEALPDNRVLIHAAGDELCVWTKTEGRFWGAGCEQPDDAEYLIEEFGHLTVIWPLPPAHHQLAETLETLAQVRAQLDGFEARLREEGARMLLPTGEQAARKILDAYGIDEPAGPVDVQAGEAVIGLVQIGPSLGAAR